MDGTGQICLTVGMRRLPVLATSWIEADCIRVEALRWKLRA